MRVIVTGSRDYKDPTIVRAALDEAYDVDGSLILLHGACPTGADWFAEEWAIDRQRGPDEYANVRVERFRADWTRHGRMAGPIRNTAMVAAGADLCLAFFQFGALNIGTAGCCRIARAAGITVREYGREIQETPDCEQETLPI